MSKIIKKKNHIKKLDEEKKKGLRRYKQKIIVRKRELLIIKL